MTSLDTNVLLRYVLGDDRAQAERARQLIDDECDATRRAHVNLVVVAELMWFARRRLKASRDECADMLAGLLDNSHLALADETVVVGALDAFRLGPADFNDYLIAYLNVANDSAPTRTFDRQAARDPAFSLLETGA